MLFLNETKITDAGLLHLQGLKQLWCLGLSHTPVTDAGLRHLHGMQKLGQLELEDTKVTDTGLIEITKALPKCHIFFDRSRHPNVRPWWERLPQNEW